MTLEELIQTVFSQVWEKSGGEVDVDCCFCDDTKRRLGINVQTGVAHCFNCDFRSGDRTSSVNSRKRTFDKICEATNYDAEFSLDENEVIAKPHSSEVVKKTAEVRLPKEYEPLWRDVNDKVGREALNYLRNRSVDRAAARKHRIGFCGTGIYSHRIVFPVTFGKKLTGFVTRDFTGRQEPKYLNSRGNKGLYNLPAHKFRQTSVILLEGIFDVLSVERAKIKGWDIVGNLGSKLKMKNLKQLRSYREVCIWTEPDRAGVEGTIKRAKQLQRKHRRVFVIVPLQDVETDSDPGDMSVEEVRQRFKERVEFSPSVASLMRLRIAYSEPVKQKKPFINKLV